MNTESEDEVDLRWLAPANSMHAADVAVLTLLLRMVVPSAMMCRRRCPTGYVTIPSN